MSMEHFSETPTADSFVQLHEDFCHGRKDDEYEVHYSSRRGRDLANFDTDGMTSLRLSCRQAAIRFAEEERLENMSIAKFPDGAFKGEYSGLVPNLPVEYRLPNSVKDVCNAVTTGDARAVLLHGPAGSGKSMSCKLICRETGLPVLDVVSGTGNLDEFVLGKYNPEGEGFVFRESFVTKAIRDGGAVIFEEINFGKPQHLAFLNSLLDDNGFVRLDSGDVVRRHPNFRLFATMNYGYDGTKELNHALYNRFNAVVEQTDLDDYAIERMLVARVPECKPNARKLTGVYTKLKAKISSEEREMVISPRNLENWARLARRGVGYPKAAENAIVPIAKGDRAFEDAIRSIVKRYKWR
jgi:MoxR-like ATPase